MGCQSSYLPPARPAMIQTQPVSDNNPFARSRATFDRMCEQLRRPDAFAMTHASLERLLSTDGREILRQMFQDHLDLRGAHEQSAPHRSVVGEDGIERPHRR